MLKNGVWRAPDAAIPRARWPQRDLRCDPGERGTWWFDGQRLQLTPHARCMQSTRWAPATPGMARSPLRWPRSSRPGGAAVCHRRGCTRVHRGLAGAMASPLATRSMPFAPLFAEKQLNFFCPRYILWLWQDDTQRPSAAVSLSSPGWASGSFVGSGDRISDRSPFFCPFLPVAPAVATRRPESATRRGLSRHQ